MVSQFLAHKPVSLALLHHFQNHWNFDYECNCGRKHKTAFWARKTRNRGPGPFLFTPSSILFHVDMKSCECSVLHLNFLLAVLLTWDQALFSFRFENYIPAGKAKRKESLIQTFNEMSAAHFFDWLTFAESANQNYFRCLFFSYANFSRVEKMQTGWLKK